MASRERDGIGAGTIGLGVAGNFTGHLEQAGEDSDFVNVAVKDAAAPKGIFPFYVPNATGARDHPLHRDPLSSAELRLGAAHEKHQIEPEVALLCDLAYEAGRVVSVTPRFAMAHNDCSIRREGARKISEKKNWGPASKGTARERIALDHFAPGGVLDHYRLACFLVRDGEALAYGQDSPVSGYSYFHQQLLDWLVEKMNEQQDDGPLEDISAWLENAGHPKQALISIGATRYTAYGETTFLAPGDRSVVLLYDARRFDAEAMRALAADAEATVPEGVSRLSQRVV